MSHFAQHTVLQAIEGRGASLAQKFLDAAEIQRSNADCEAMLVSRSPSDPDTVYLTEVWTSRQAWEAATRSEVIAAWAKDMPGLVAAAPTTTPLVPLGGKGILHQEK
jgi:quinol monooxygenase YgiN